MALSAGEQMDSGFVKDADRRLVVVGSSAGAVSVAQSPLTAAAVTSTAASATVVTLKAASATRRALKLFNDSVQALFVKDGSAATTASYSVRVAAGGHYEYPLPIYQGIVTGIWAAADATGAALVTEGT